MQPALHADPIAPHLWRLSRGAGSVIEFRNHLALFGLSEGDEQAKATLAIARSLVAGKPVTQLILSHCRLERTAGLRQAVAEGLTIIARRQHEGLFSERVLQRPDGPADELARSPRPLQFIGVDAHLRLSDTLMTLDLFRTRQRTDQADDLLAYAPHQQFLLGSRSVRRADSPPSGWTRQLRDLIDEGAIQLRSPWPLASGQAGCAGKETRQERPAAAPRRLRPRA